MYINNFADKGRQNTMDLLLVGRHDHRGVKADSHQGRLMGQTPVHLYDPINDFVTSELSKRSVLPALRYHKADDLQSVGILIVKNDQNMVGHVQSERQDHGHQRRLVLLALP